MSDHAAEVGEAPAYMSHISTHVLDTAAGQPAAGIPVRLEVHSGNEIWKVLGEGATDTDGRLKLSLPAGISLATGTYRLRFDTGSYFRAQKIAGLYPEVAIVFEVRDPRLPFHIPLLLSPHGYTTYRGS